MLLFTILTLVSHVVLNLVALTWRQESEKTFMTNKALAILNFVTLGLNVALTGPIIYLLAFHEFLMRKNRTTFEQIQIS